MTTPKSRSPTQGSPAFGKALQVREFQATTTGEECFSGTLMAGASNNELIEPVSPALALCNTVLEPTRGFLSALSDVYNINAEDHAGEIALVQRLGTSHAFISDTLHRRAMLEVLAHKSFEQPGFLFFHPPTTLWDAYSESARYLLHQVPGRNLKLCTLLGSVGFAQLCDDILRYPIPLLVQPYHPEHGLIGVINPPRKSFSKSLSVRRLARNRLLLIDKQTINYRPSG